jgi:hypothetical protein
VKVKERYGREKQIAALSFLRGRAQQSLAADGAIADYDADFPLVIDPVLVYSTLLGGSEYDRASSIAVDNVGNIYVAGVTASTDFPAATYVQPIDCFLTKFDPTGKTLLYTAIFGGTYGFEGVTSLVVDNLGNAWIDRATSI